MKILIANTGLVIGLIILTATFGCGNEETTLDNTYTCINTENRTCVLYEQTDCADPWENNDVNVKLLDNFEDYLNDLGITLYYTGIDNNGENQDCHACTCKTGKRLFAKINTKDLANVKELGFIEY